MEAGRRDHVWERDRTRVRWFADLSRALRVRAYGFLDDEALVSRVRARDHAAYDALVVRYRDRLYTMALDSLGNERAAGEALCETMVTAYRDLASMSGDCTPRTWLYLHGFRAVLRRLDAPAGRYSVEWHEDDDAAGRT